MIAPVIDPTNGKACMLNLSEVTFIQLGENRRDLFFGTKGNSPRLVRSVQEMAAAVDGTDFMRVDQNMIVNLNRATYDYNEYKLLFEPAGIDNLTSCHVSRDNRAKVKKWFLTY